jgi:hypothetical protein
MQSIVFSNKSMADIKDPVIKGLVEDISTIMQAEFTQAVQDVKQPEGKKTRRAVSAHFEEVATAYRQMSTEDKTRFNKMGRKLNSASLKRNTQRLGIDLSKDIPASEQVDVSKHFAHLKGKAALITEKLDAIGHTVVVPFVAFPDPATSSLIQKIKAADPEANKYADYLRLLDKNKLVELYEREAGTIAEPEAFLETHEPDASEITKIKRTVAEWQRRERGGNPPKYKNNRLKLIITRVRCVDETEHEGAWPFEGEGIANDRIDLGAINIAPNGRTTRFAPQMVSDNFEDNREFVWNREIARFDLSSQTYPANYASTITISEIDYGAGFANTLNEIWGKIRNVIVEVVTKIGEVIGTILGSGEAGKFVGKIVGELVTLGLSELISIVGRAVQDDVFDPRALTIRLDSPYSTFSGVVDKVPGPFRSPEQELIFEGFGGSYRVYAVWELERISEGTTAPIEHRGQVLRITTQTGGDDLRGYNHAFFTINYTNGTSSREYLLHRGHGGGHRSEQNFPLDTSIALSSIRSITIRHDGSPNWPDGYDNWNLDHLKVALITGEGAAITVHESSGAPLIRFTGSVRTFVAHRQG